jgi:hypothetical protein
VIIVIDINHKEIVEKNFIIEENGDGFNICYTYYLIEPDLMTQVHYVDCVICGATVNVHRVLSHSVWHESLVYKDVD